MSEVIISTLFIRTKKFIHYFQSVYTIFKGNQLMQSWLIICIFYKHFIHKKYTIDITMHLRIVKYLKYIKKLTLPVESKLV